MPVLKFFPRTEFSLNPFYVAIATIVLAASPAKAQTSYDEQYKLIRAPNAVTTLGPDLFGDTVNLYTGKLEFSQTDVSLTGNNSLPVSMGRRLDASDSGMPGRQFGRWEADIPHLHGIFSASKGWVSWTGSTMDRCTNFGGPLSVAGTGNRSAWDPSEFWQGNFIYVPGAGDQQMLRRDPNNVQVPGGNVAAYPAVTTKFWSISCLPSLANDTTAGQTLGQGFLALAPDGTQYRFDWITDFSASTLSKSTPEPGLVASPSTQAMRTGQTSKNLDAAPSSQAMRTELAPEAPAPNIVAGYTLVRKEVWILPTMVTDRFGNWVRYTYDPARPRNVTRIESSDGRVLVIGYTTGDDSIRSVFDGTRTWTYGYANGDLTTVTLPDNSAWQLGNIYSIMSQAANPNQTDCETPAALFSGSMTGSMQHPSGATGQFSLTPTTHGRSGVPYACVYSDSGVRNAILRWFYTNSLTTKSISGPGLTALNWTYDYGPANSSWSDCTNCPTTKTVSVTDPDGRVTRHVLGNLIGQTEGRIEQVDVGGLRTTSTQYAAYGAGPYIDYIGTGDTNGGGDSDQLARQAPAKLVTTTQQGVTFTRAVNSFDSAFLRPTNVTRSSSLGARTETTAYADNLTTWVIGQVASVTEASTGQSMVANGYDASTSTLKSVTKFGHLDATMTYFADGTLNTVKDGKDHATTYSNYMRGIPQSIVYADGASESAVIDNIGNFTSVTNAANFTTSFGYTAGRLSSIAYPAGGQAWNGTSITFAPVTGTEYDLPAGHWRQTVTTGNASNSTYYDALWRPVYSYTADNANPGATAHLVKRQFDHNGHTTFESYPKRTYADIGTGVQTQYDALGRAIAVGADSDSQVLWTRINYLGGFQKEIADPKGNVSTSSFQAFDEPSENAITGITAPLFVAVAINRDVFGKTLSITRSGAGKSATRSYVYDSNARLCKTIEPETGATVQDYDLANNVAWRATGLALPSSSCDTTSVPPASKMTFGYDARNRLASTTFGDASPAITRTYTADSLPDTVTSNGTVWTNGYDNRRNNTSESMVYGGAAYSIGRSYDANGSLNLLTYPDQSSVDYAPNALGQPTKVGTFASGVTYHSNGAIAGFTYGNGIVHTMTPNTRGLPQVSSDAGILNDKYTYDENANVTAIDDLQEGISNRAMTYDGLDRLTTTTSAATLFGTVTNIYDSLDNLTNVTVTLGPTARSTTHNFDPATNRLTSIASATGAYNLDYGYDVQGNITTRGGRSFVFDQANRMKSAVGIATYAYDGLGHRVSTVGTDGVNRVSVYTQGGQLLYTRSTSLPLATGTKYIYLGRHEIAEVKAAGAN